MPVAEETKVVDVENQGAPPAIPGPTSEKKERTYTAEEYLKAVSDERANAGRLKTQVDTLTKERNTFKSQADEATATLTETQERITDLEKDLETAISDNIDLAEIQKIKKELRTEKAKAAQETKAEKEALRQERETWAATVSTAQDRQFKDDVLEVAKEFEGGDSERLKALCEKTGKHKREEIQDIASIFWPKLGAKSKEENPLITADPGISNGGGNNLGNLLPKERVKEAERLLRLDAHKNR